MAVALVGQMPNGFSCSDWLTAAPGLFSSCSCASTQIKPHQTLMVDVLPRPPLCFYACSWSNANKGKKGRERGEKVTFDRKQDTTPTQIWRKETWRMLHTHGKKMDLKENHRHPRVDHQRTAAGRTGWGHSTSRIQSFKIKQLKYLKILKTVWETVWLRVDSVLKRPQPSSLFLCWQIWKEGELMWVHAGIKSIITPDPMMSPESRLLGNCRHLPGRCAVSSTAILKCLTGGAAAGDVDLFSTFHHAGRYRQVCWAVHTSASPLFCLLFAAQSIFP